MVWGESDSMPPQVSSKRRIATNFLEFIAIPKIMKVKVELSPKKMETRNKSQDWSPQEEFFFLIIFPVLSCCQKVLKVEPNKRSRQITGLIATRRITTKILEFIAITQKLWKWKWKWRYCQKRWGQETNHNIGLITTRRITRPILDFIAEAFRGITSKVKVIEIAPFIAQHLLLNKFHFFFNC